MLTAAQHDVIYIAMVIQFGVVVLEAVKTESNIPISINNPSTVFHSHWLDTWSIQNHILK
jgi:hypothetical protein